MQPEPVSFSARLRRLAEEAPAAPQIAMGQRSLTRDEFHRRSNRIARGLQSLGLQVGDLLTIALPNSIEFMEVAVACWKLGATPQPVSSRLPTAELDAIAELARSPFVVGETGLQSRFQVKDAGQLLALSADDSALPDAVAPCWKAPTSGGSTGRPKLILSGSPSVHVPDLAVLWRIGADEIALMPGPLYHNGPFLTSSLVLLSGARLVLMPKFDAEEVLRQIAATRATWIYLVPTMMSRIQRLPDEVRARYDVSSLRSAWHLAAPCPPWLKKAWIDWLGPDVVYELYGATEGQAATIISGAEWLRKPGSVGRVVMGEMKVVGPDGRDAPPGELGEVYMRPVPGNPTPYFYRGATAVQIEGGWETVGDIGSIDADGYVFLADRRSDMILVGGSNVYPAEIEAALEEHDAVQSCAVIGLPDEDLGQRIHAIVQPRRRIEPEALQAHVAERLVRYKVPRSIEFVDFSVRDDAGKVRRSQLRAERMPARGG